MPVLFRDSATFFSALDRVLPAYHRRCGFGAVAARAMSAPLEPLAQGVFLDDLSAAHVLFEYLMHFVSRKVGIFYRCLVLDLDCSADFERLA